MSKAGHRKVSLTERVFWLSLAKTFAFACNLALPILLTRRLSQADFGVYKQVFLVVGTASLMLSFGFGMSALYFMPRERERQERIVCNVVFFNTLVGAAACLALLLRPSLLAAIFGSDVGVAEHAHLIGVIIMLWIVSSFIDLAPVAREETALASILILVTQLSRTLLLLGAALSFASVRALVWATVVQAVLQTALMFYYLHSRWPGFWRHFDGATLRRQLAYALPLGAAGFLFALQADLHNYFVSNHFGAAAFAVYSIGCFQLPLVGILTDAVGSVLIPRVSALQSRGEREQIVVLTAQAARKLAAVFFPIYAFLMVTGYEFIELIFSRQYLSSWPVFAVNLTLLPFSVLLFDPILRAYTEHRKFLLKLQAALLVSLFVVLYFGTESLGLVGVIAVVVLAHIINRLVTGLKVGRILRLGLGDLWLLKDVYKLAVAAGGAALAAALVRGAAGGAHSLVILVACGAVFSLVYLVAVLLLNVPTHEERGIVNGRIARVRLKVFRRRAPAPLP